MNLRWELRLKLVIWISGFLIGNNLKWYPNVNMLVINRQEQHQRNVRIGIFGPNALDLLMTGWTKIKTKIAFHEGNTSCVAAKQ